MVRNLNILQVSMELVVKVMIEECGDWLGCGVGVATDVGVGVGEAAGGVDVGVGARERDPSPRPWYTSALRFFPLDHAPPPASMDTFYVTVKLKIYMTKLLEIMKSILEHLSLWAHVTSSFSIQKLFLSRQKYTRPHTLICNLFVYLMLDSLITWADR